MKNVSARRQQQAVYDTGSVAGFGENSASNLLATPLKSSASAGGGLVSVMFGQIAAYFAFSSIHRSAPSAVPLTIASAGHSGSQTPQSMHSSGWMTSMFSPS